MQNGTVLETDMALALGAAGRRSMDAKGGGCLEQRPHLRLDPHGLAQAPPPWGPPCLCSFAVVIVIVQLLSRV